MNGSELKEQIVNKIIEVNPNVAGQVIRHFVDIEIKRRTELVIKVIDKLNQMSIDRKKLNKPDSIVHSGLGNDAEKIEQWTDVRRSQAKSLDERIAKLNTAISRAIGPDADYQELEKIGKMETEKKVE